MFCFFNFVMLFKWWLSIIYLAIFGNIHPTLVRTYQCDSHKDDIYSILKHMVVSMVKPRWLLQIYAWNVSIVDSTWFRIGIRIPNFGMFSGWSQCLYPEGQQTQGTMCTKYASTLMATQTYHSRMCFHPNFPSSFLFSSLGHPFRVTHPVPIRLLEFSSKHMYRWLEISHNLFQFYKSKPTKLVVTQEIACQLEQRNTGFQLWQFKKVM